MVDSRVTRTKTIGPVPVYFRKSLQSDMQLPWTTCQLKILVARPMERRRLQAIYAAERRRPPYNHAYSATDIGRNTYSKHCTTPMANIPSASAQQTVLFNPCMCMVYHFTIGPPYPWTSSHRAIQLVGVSRVQYHTSAAEVTKVDRCRIPRMQVTDRQHRYITVSPGHEDPRLDSLCQPSPLESSSRECSTVLRSTPRLKIGAPCTDD